MSSNNAAFMSKACPCVYYHIAVSSDIPEAKSSIEFELELESKKDYQRL
ncbi:MAG: hypothetical protein JO327_02220 [Nitrososphaeraceae archaeon]|nr:hypothetical protein [Nitrososphaeraceae archaeon]MBV9666927.1 hypothetical protein [Nitrososphaeraceae archaeon]